jgi:hypothetical protein
MIFLIKRLCLIKIFMRIINLLLFIILGLLFLSPVSSQVKYDLESAGTKWTTNYPDYWSVNSEKPSNGSYSLKYEQSDDFVDTALYSIEVGYTIQKVRTANFDNANYIIASSYEGTVMAVSYDGAILWKNMLSGFMVHDMWCADLTGDSNDEIVVANADGYLYCLDSNGVVLWQYKKNDTPMYATTVVVKDDTPYVVCGGLDLNIYYLSSTGTLVKELKSSSYSEEKTWGANASPSNTHYTNFLRPIRKANGDDMLVIHASNNHMQDKGAIYLFEVLANSPIKRIESTGASPKGELRFSDYNNDGIKEILLGASSHQNESNVVRLNLSDDTQEVYNINQLGFGYSVVQPELITDVNTEKYMFLVGNHMALVGTDLDVASEEKLESKYSYFDVWKKPTSNKLIFASCQSGGSQIHILDTGKTGWKTAYQELRPKGKIQKIIDNTESVRTNLTLYQRPTGEREPLPAYFMSSSTDTGISRAVANNIRANYTSSIFLGGSHMGLAEDWDRSVMANEKYKNKRDGRRNYSLTQQGAVDYITKWYDEFPDGDTGIAYWGGHGNDPYMFQLSTTKQILDYANGKKTVLIYPELEDHSDDFAWVMEDFFYPLATYGQAKNANIFVRTKHNFWQGNIYLPMWDRVRSGEFADVFVPAMEETTDKSVDISIAGRIGIWASGAVNSWGTRAVPDNPSFDRSRQFSQIRLPNNYLRYLIFHMANGAQYLNNLISDPDYISVLWDLVAKGALYIPKPNEIVSLSPVHLSMLTPDEHYLFEGSSLKWSTFYDEAVGNNDNYVFSRNNASWPAAKVTDWDFSRYAGNVKDRRQNFIAGYPNGMVLITPPQQGANADLTAPRGALKDHLHPLYKDILKEFYTDGHKYYSADGNQTYDANQYYTTVENQIKASAQLIPLTVSGDNVAWVVSQTSPTNLRLTIIDGGYLNPGQRKAKVKFQTVAPISMTDILDGTTFNLNNTAAVSVDIPCGGFRFIDIELTSPL